MKSFFAVLLIQAAVPPGGTASEVRGAEEWARFVAGSAIGLEDLFKDAGVRAEVKRVGLKAGCQSAMDAVFETRANGRDELLPFARDAAEAVVPAEVLRTTPPGGILTGRSYFYLEPVAKRFQQTARESLVRMRSAASTLMRQRTRDLTVQAPDEADAQAVSRAAQLIPNGNAEQVFERPFPLVIACLARIKPKPPEIRMEAITAKQSG